MKEPNFSVAIPVYRTYLDVYLSSNQKQLNKWHEQILSKHNATIGEFTSRASTYDIYIDRKGFRRVSIIFNLDKLSHGVIAHEIMHAVFYILDYIDIKLSLDSEEAFTCLQEYLVESVYHEGLMESIQPE